MSSGRASAPPILLVAASGLAREAAVAAREGGLRVAGCLDDDPSLWGTEVAPGLPVLGGLDVVAAQPDARLTICAGKGSGRERLAARLQGLGVDRERFVTIVHPSVSVPDRDAVGAGSILLAGVVLTADVIIGEHVVCMPHVVLTHDCRVGSFATLCAAVVLGGRVVVGRGAYVGMAAAVRESLTIGESAVVGMGAVVLSDVPAGETWAGLPARPIRG